VWLDDVMRDPSPVVVSNQPPGEHLLVVSKAGFQEIRQTVALAAEQRVAVDLKLKPIRGLVLLVSEPAGAEVQVNDATRGNTPLFLTDLALGQYRLKFVMQGCQTKTVDVDIKDRLPLRVDVALTSDSAAVSIESDPPGATATLNGIEVGTTPCKAERIPGGESLLVLSLAGYRPAERKLRLQAGQQETVAITLESLPAQLTVVSIPEKARIYVDDEFQGEAPVTIGDLTAGEHRVRAELAGFDPLARTVTLAQAQKITEEFRLEGNFGTLAIVTEPAGVTVLVDGKEAGVTVARDQSNDTVSRPLTVNNLTIGRHTVRLARKGFFAKDLKVELNKDETASLRQKLERDFQPDYEVLTYQGVERGVLVGTDAAGNVQLEVRPNIFRTIASKDIRSQGPIKRP
jgi:hypothetical protein